MSPAKGKNNLEQNLDALESIVTQLESGDLCLENSLIKFEQGTRYYKECKKMLNKAEKKIMELTDQLKEIDLNENQLK